MREEIGPLVSRLYYEEAKISDGAVKNYDRYKELSVRIETLEQENAELKKTNKILCANNAKLESAVEQLGKRVNVLEQGRRFVERLCEPTLIPGQMPIMMDMPGKEEPQWYWGTDNIWGTKKVKRGEIEIVVFQDSIEQASSDAWDVSDAGNQSVLAWMGSRQILYIAGEGGVKANKNCAYMFSGCNNLREIYFGKNFDTSSVTDMRAMFSGCNNLRKIDVTGFDTSSVTDMSQMFKHCEKLTELDVTGFNTSSVTNMSGMFEFCEKLIELDVTGFNTSNVTDMLGMFLGCTRMRKLDISGLNTSNVINMRAMFSGCSQLTELDVADFDTTNVVDMEYMFKDTIWEKKPIIY